MNRCRSTRSLIAAALLTLCLGLASAASADESRRPGAIVADGVAIALDMQGYEIVSESRTMLGRIRIVARNHLHEREIVISPTTGEVKRDVVTRRFVDYAPTSALSPSMRMPGRAD